MIPITEIIMDNLKYPESLSQIHYLYPFNLPLDLVARLKCYNCGLYKRAILCPPYLWQTYEQFRTYKSTKKFLRSFDTAVVFAWRNDGSRSWKLDKRELSHVELKPKKGRQLKGTEAGQSRELCKLMRTYRKEVRKHGYNAFAFIPGHCDSCGGKCPDRDNPPCKKGGMPSLEAAGIDVYKLLENIGVEYEHPVENYLTSVTMLLVGGGVK